MFWDYKELPYIIALAILGVILGGYELGRFAWFVAHHIQIIW
jgi:hypothetical protein